ncbi:MAG: hypothetical protein A7316_00100 [Candidatus Altiarchaeales archaeon WOR_SM1_86-2]|nr:MAG: hypothetical protein A7316_00100 [Candidatus Altiarchaeales archaeon WOR_SM1_86-2]
MRHYSIWLKKHDSRGNQILNDLQSYKREVMEIKDKIYDKDLILPIDAEQDHEIDPDFRLCFVDGGESNKELLGASVYFIRASALLWKDQTEFIRDLDMGVIDYDEHTKERVELLRGAMEFDVAIRSVELKTPPTHIFLDGSLHVNAKKRQIKGSEYGMYRKKLVRLMKLCREKEVSLVGVSEDSTSRLFAHYISALCYIELPKFMTDSSILRMLTKDRCVCYRTIQFTPYSKFASELDEDLVVSFPTVYVQPTPLSNPLRIDVPEWEQNFDGIINLVLKLSKGSRYYGYPLPLYLVHLDVKIGPKLSEWNTRQLIHFISREDPDLYDAILRSSRKDMRF